MRKFLALVVFLTVAFAASVIAQVSISGTVLTGGKPLSLCAIKLMLGNQVVGSASTNELGTFSIILPQAGSFQLQCSHVGFNEYVNTVSVPSEKITINLLPQKAKSVGEVKAVAEKPVTKFSAEKKVYNVGQDATAAGGAAVDLLRNVPGVQVDPVDGTPSIRGNTNILLLIDGRQSVIFGNDINTALQTIPASSIESIEVINNPGAQFDAQGKGGALNIIMKKDNKFGYNGQVGLNIGLPYRFNVNAGGNIKVKKINIFANGSFRNSYTWTDEIIERKNLKNDTTFTTTSYTSRRPLNAFVNLGMDYQISKKDKITISQNFFNGNMRGDIETNYMPQLNFGSPLTRQSRFNEYAGMPKNGTTSLQFTHGFAKKGQELKTDISYGISRYRRVSNFTTNNYDAADNLFGPQSLQSIPVNGGNNNFTGTVDYSHPFSEDKKLDVGVKFIDFQFRSRNFPTLSINGGPQVFNDLLFNKFNYTQRTYASYANYKTKFKNLAIQSGLRYEYFTYNGFVEQYNQSLVADFSNLFPSLYLTQKVNSKSDMSLSYVKRVNRPNFFQMVPYLDVSNPQDTTMGNPALKPEFIHAVELGYNLNFGIRNNLLWSVYYQYNDNIIQRYKRFNGNGTTFSRSENLSSGITYGTEVNVKYFISKLFDVNINGNVFRNKINGSNIDASVTNEGWGGFAKLIANYRTRPGYDLQLSSNYQAPTIIAQGRTLAYYNVDVAVKKQVLKKALTITLGANDIFNTIRNQSLFEVPGIYEQLNNRKPQTRQITLGFQLRFANKAGMNLDIPRRGGGRMGGNNDAKDVKSRDENFKKDDRDEDSGSDNRSNTTTPNGGAPTVPTKPVIPPTGTTGGK
jgi:iron complex outermembrane recepter protein